MTLTFASGNVLEHPALNNMVRVLNGDGVISGFAVTQKGTGANMSVDVALGSALMGGLSESESGTTNVVIAAAHATLERKDLITYDKSADTPAVIKGTDHAGTSADPTYPPDIPADDILLAIVKVDAAATIIENGDITDGRIIRPLNHIYTTTASDDLRESDDTEDTFTDATFVKQKELVTVPKGIFNGALRLKFSLKRSGDAATVHGRIYRNGVAVGTDQTRTVDSYEIFSEDITGWYEDDTIELWCYRDTAGTATGYCDDFRAYCAYKEITTIQATPVWV